MEVKLRMILWHRPRSVISHSLGLNGLGLYLKHAYILPPSICTVQLRGYFSNFDELKHHANGRVLNLSIEGESKRSNIGLCVTENDLKKKGEEYLICHQSIAHMDQK